MNDPDNLLTALGAARPEPDDPPSTASPEAIALLTRILAQPQIAERAHPTRPTRRLVLAGIPAIVAAAAAGGIAVASSDVGPSAKVGPGSTSSPSRTEAAALRTAILDAFDQASSDILAATASLSVPGAPQFGWRSWTYPTFPQPSQQVMSRRTWTRDGRVLTDEESVYIQPSPTRHEPVKGLALYIDYGSRMWFHGQAANVLDLTLGPDPAQIRADIASGTFHVAGPGELDGRPAVKVILPVQPASARTAWTLWVDALTYMPLQLLLSIIRVNGTVQTTTRVEYRVLPATRANLALLVPPVPAGFTRTMTVPSGL